MHMSLRCAEKDLGAVRPPYLVWESRMSDEGPFWNSYLMRDSRMSGEGPFWNSSSL